MFASLFPKLVDNSEVFDVVLSLSLDWFLVVSWFRVSVVRWELLDGEPGWLQGDARWGREDFLCKNDQRNSGGKPDKRETWLTLFEH